MSRSDEDELEAAIRSERRLQSEGGRVYREPGERREGGGRRGLEPIRSSWRRTTLGPQAAFVAVVLVFMGGSIARSFWHLVTEWWSVTTIEADEEALRITNTPRIFFLRGRRHVPLSEVDSVVVGERKTRIRNGYKTIGYDVEVRRAGGAPIRVQRFGERSEAEQLAGRIEGQMRAARARQRRRA